MLFIDEIHRMSPAVEEMLYPALEDYEVDIVIGQGPSARTVKMRVEPFTLIGATTRTGLLTSPLRSRFGIVHRLEFYTPADLEEIVRRSARIWACRSSTRRPAEIARRAARTPRIVNRLLRRVRDYAQVRATARITLDVAHAGLKLLEVDEHGFDEIDRKVLRTIIDKFGGGPVGLNTIAAAISEEKDAIEDIYEPYLIQIGFLDRTPRGRVATPRAYEYFGLAEPRRDHDCGNAQRQSAGSPRAPAAGRRRSRRSRPTCRRASSPTPISSRCSTRPTSGSCSAVGIRERHIADAGVATSDLGEGSGACGDRARRAHARRHRRHRRRHGHART